MNAREIKWFSDAKTFDRVLSLVRQVDYTKNEKEALTGLSNLFEYAKTLEGVDRDLAFEFLKCSFDNRLKNIK